MCLSIHPSVVRPSVGFSFSDDNLSTVIYVSIGTGKNN